MSKIFADKLEIINSDALQADVPNFREDLSPKKRGLGGLMETSEIPVAGGIDFSSGNGV